MSEQDISAGAPGKEGGVAPGQRDHAGQPTSIQQGRKEAWQNSTSSQVSDSEIRASIQRHAEEEIAEAIFDQLPMIRKGLAASGETSPDAVDEVLSDVSEQVLRKMPDYERHGQVPLPAWVAGFTRNVLAERKRMRARRAAREVELEDGSLMGRFVSLHEVTDSDDAFFLELIAEARERIVSAPGGAKRWQRLVDMAGKPQRGRSAREEVREELAEISGLPPETFGTEQMGDE